MCCVTRCVTFVTCLARLVKWLNPTRGRLWFFHLSWARGVFTEKSFVLTFPLISAALHFLSTLQTVRPIYKQSIQTSPKLVPRNCKNLVSIISSFNSLDFRFCLSQEQPVRIGPKTVCQQLAKIRHHNSPPSCGCVLSNSTSGIRAGSLLKG